MLRACVPLFDVFCAEIRDYRTAHQEEADSIRDMFIARGRVKSTLDPRYSTGTFAISPDISRK